jgi:hypothetical protein
MFTRRAFFGNNISDILLPKKAINQSRRKGMALNMKKNFLYTVCLLLAAVFLLSGCDKKLSVKLNDNGFYDKKNDIQYVPCSERAVRPVNDVGEKDEYATDGDTTYYKIKFEKSENFLCDKKDGVSFVYRNSKLEDITIKNFNPIAAQIWLGDATYLDTFFCAQKYLPDEKKDESAPDDSALVYAIRDALKNGEAVTVDSSNMSTEHEYYLRLLSADFPGLYYTVIFYTDKKGAAYIEDRGSGISVACPDNVKKRLIG